MSTEAGNENRKDGRRLARVLIVVGAAGLGAMAIPFFPSGSEERWRFPAPEDLREMTVNAEVSGTHGVGVLLLRQGSRSISVITPPLELPDTTNDILEVDAYALATKPVEVERHVTPFRLLWQTTPGESFHFLDAELIEGRARLSLPERPERIHRLGVQFPGAEVVVVAALGLPRLSAGERFGVFVDQILAGERLRNHSMNFIRGPMLLGHGLNYFLLTMVAVGIGGYGVWLLRRGAEARASRSCHAAVIGAVALAVWVAADLVVSVSLARTVLRDAAELRKADDPQLQALAGWPDTPLAADIAWAAKTMQGLEAGGASFAVVSDDVFTPGHRLAYLLCPVWVRREAISEAEYVVVIQASGASYAEGEKAFNLRGEVFAPYERVGVRSDAVYVLRRGAK